MKKYLLILSVLFAVNLYAQKNILSKGGVFVTTDSAWKANLHDVQLSTLGITHVWQCNDAVGSSSITDSKGSVPIVLGGNILGNAGLLNDGQTGLLIPQEGNGLINGIGTLNSNGAYTLEFIAEINPMTNTDNQTILFSFGSSERYGFLLLSMSDHSIQDQDVDQSTQGNFLTSIPSLIDIVVDPYGNGIFYQNGFKLLSFEIDLDNNRPDGSFTLGRSPPSPDFSYNPLYSPILRIQDIAIYNVELTPAQINAHLIAARK